MRAYWVTTSNVSGCLLARSFMRNLLFDAFIRFARRAIVIKRGDYVKAAANESNVRVFRFGKVQHTGSCSVTRVSRTSLRLVHIPSTMLRSDPGFGEFRIIAGSITIRNWLVRQVQGASTRRTRE